MILGSFLAGLLSGAGFATACFLAGVYRARATGVYGRQAVRTGRSVEAGEVSTLTAADRRKTRATAWQESPAPRPQEPPTIGFVDHRRVRPVRRRQ